MKASPILFTFVIFVLTTNIKAQTYSYDFTTGYEGWSGDFADYPATDSISFELDRYRTTLPAPLNTNKFALKVTGNNHSDDLFMFIKRKISGLLPNVTYKLFINVEFASKAPTNAVGVGGAPGEAVRMKAGATVVEPLKILDSKGYYRMNINKSNQVSPGMDMDTIGHVGVSDTTKVFTLINRNNATHLFTITADEKGEVWVCIGTDSGFESTTTLYYNLITLTFTSVLGLEDSNMPKGIIIYPNPTKGFIKVKVNEILLGKKFTILNQEGKMIWTGKLMYETSTINIQELPNGIYFFQIQGQDKQAFKIMKE